MDYVSKSNKFYVIKNFQELTYTYTHYKPKLNTSFICDNSLVMEPLKGCCLHILGGSVLPSSETSPVPAQHVMHPPNHRLMAVTGHLAALFFILQSNKGRKGQMNL